MVTKNKNAQPKKLARIISHVGMTVVALATVLNLTELASREGHQLAATLQPAYAAASPDSGNTQNDKQTVQSYEMRRSGREEIRHSSATYGAATRSHSISGSV